MAGCIAPGCGSPREVGAFFCLRHLLSPAPQRGGWLSAERRRRDRAASDATEVPLDMSNITPRLWVGAKPPFDRDLPEFDMLVLCAQELQPKTLGFQRQVVRAPLPDSVLTTDQIRTALLAGRSVGAALASGKRVLVTCYAGLNRSALVASLALGHVTLMTGPQIVELVRRRRTPGVPVTDGALHNLHFVKLIEQFMVSRKSAAHSSAVQSARRRRGG